MYEELSTISDTRPDEDNVPDLSAFWYDYDLVIRVSEEQQVPELVAYVDAVRCCVRDAFRLIAPSICLEPKVRPTSAR